MNAYVDPSLTKFAVGQPVSRKEDPVLLRGERLLFGGSLLLAGRAMEAGVQLLDDDGAISLQVRGVSA